VCEAVEEPGDLLAGADGALDGLDRGVAVQDEPTVPDRDVVMVDVDHARPRRGLLGDLVDVLLGRDAGADVEELADAGLADQEPGSAAEEGLVRLGQWPGYSAPRRPARWRAPPVSLLAR
jgi:hypothetical protein